VAVLGRKNIEAGKAYAGSNSTVDLFSKMRPDIEEPVIYRNDLICLGIDEYVGHACIQNESTFFIFEDFLQHDDALFTDALYVCLHTKDISHHRGPSVVDVEVRNHVGNACLVKRTHQPVLFKIGPPPLFQELHIPRVVYMTEPVCMITSYLYFRTCPHIFLTAGMPRPPSTFGKCKYLALDGFCQIYALTECQVKTCHTAFIVSVLPGVIF
jgi:hypothetical protein